jgi:hypothetical protein
MKLIVERWHPFFAALSILDSGALTKAAMVSAGRLAVDEPATIPGGNLRGCAI